MSVYHHWVCSILGDKHRSLDVHSEKGDMVCPDCKGPAYRPWSTYHCDADGCTRQEIQKAPGWFYLSTALSKFDGNDWPGGRPYNVHLCSEEHLRKWFTANLDVMILQTIEISDSSAKDKHITLLEAQIEMLKHNVKIVP